MKKLYKFEWDCGRQGTLSGIFVADSEHVKKAIGMNANFGEALGKHSEIYGQISEGDITELTDDQAFIETFLKFGCSSGTNPLYYLRDEDGNDISWDDLPPET